MKKTLIGKYCTISDMAKILHVGKHTLIHYEKENLISPVFRGENGYRYYSGEQISDFKKILYLRELGFSISDIKICLTESNYSNTLSQTEERLKENLFEIRALLEKRAQLIERKKILTHLKKNEQKKGTPYIEYFDKKEFVYLKQKSLDLNSTVKSMKQFDSVLKNVTWTEKYCFGFIVPIENLNNNNFEIDKFVLEANIEDYEYKYLFPASDYAILYTESKEQHEDIIKVLFDWIKNNDFLINGDLFIEDSTSYSISNKYNIGTKIYKIPVKKA
ncbi:MAG: MerR family transcriptional regulator [Cetobacterium sp.]|uniref:helix-turn-helix domain-containing protein n=1 Tax=Cetobacterium sp. TaxID=2071632 RepID=UPI003EE80EA0